MQVVVQLQLHEVVHELIHAHAARGGHIFRAQFHLGLALEDGLLYVDGYRAYYAVADVGEVLVLVEKLLNRTADSFAVGGLVGTALDGVLTVHEGVVLLAGLRGMGQGDLDVLTLQVDDGVERIYGHVLGQQIEQAVLGCVFLAVVDQRQAGVEVGIVA